MSSLFCGVIMGFANEKEINGTSIPTSNTDLGSGRGNSKDSLRGSRGGDSTIPLCGGNEHNKRGNMAKSQESLGCSPVNSTTRIRGGNGNAPDTSSLHSEEVGRRSQEKKSKMKTLVVANQKGGVGKTSTIIHLAFDFIERGMKVAVIDLDPQQNASYTLKEYKSGVKSSELFGSSEFNINTPKEDAFISLIEADFHLANIVSTSLSVSGDNFKRSIARLDAQGFDVCLIDTAPALGVTMASALLASDYVISPIELEVYSIQGIKKMSATINNIRKVNAKLKFLGIVPSMVSSRNPRHTLHLKQLNDAYPQLMVPVSIGLRTSVGDALASCLPVWKIKKTAARAAAKELRSLAKYVFDKMEIVK